MEMITISYFFLYFRKQIRVLSMVKSPVFPVHLQVCICFFFPDICVDKARLEECEERASELSRKVCNF